MANAFFSPDAAASVAAKLVGLDLRLASLFARDLEADFAGRKGSTILVQVPGALPAETRGIHDKTSTLIHHEIAEQSIPVTLTDHVYSSTLLSEGDLDLELTDFARQVLGPQSRAVASEVERRAVAALQGTPETTSIAFDPEQPARLFTAARAKLRKNGIPDAARLIAVAGVDVEAALLDGPDGTFDAAGRVRGFDVIFSNRLGAGEVVCFIPEAFALVVRAPGKPDGATYGASIVTDDENAFALRWLRNYDGGHAADQSLVSAFVEVAPMPLPVINETAGTVALVPHAGAVRIDTAA